MRAGAHGHGNSKVTRHLGDAVGVGDARVRRALEVLVGAFDAHLIDGIALCRHHGEVDLPGARDVHLARVAVTRDGGSHVGLIGLFVVLRVIDVDGGARARGTVSIDDREGRRVLSHGLALLNSVVTISDGGTRGNRLLLGGIAVGAGVRSHAFRRGAAVPVVLPRAALAGRQARRRGERGRGARHGAWPRGHNVVDGLGQLVAHHDRAGSLCVEHGVRGVGRACSLVFLAAAEPAALRGPIHACGTSGNDSRAVDEHGTITVDGGIITTCFHAEHSLPTTVEVQATVGVKTVAVAVDVELPAVDVDVVVGAAGAAGIAGTAATGPEAVVAGAARIGAAAATACGVHAVIGGGHVEAAAVHVDGARLEALIAGGDVHVGISLEAAIRAQREGGVGMHAVVARVDVERAGVDEHIHVGVHGVVDRVDGEVAAVDGDGVLDVLTVARGLDALAAHGVFVEAAGAVTRHRLDVERAGVDREVVLGLDAVAVHVDVEGAAVDGDVTSRGGVVGVGHGLDAVVGSRHHVGACIEGERTVGGDAVVHGTSRGRVAAVAARNRHRTGRVERERRVRAALYAVFRVGDAGEVAAATEGHGGVSLGLDAGALEGVGHRGVRAVLVGGVLVVGDGARGTVNQVDADARAGLLHDEGRRAARGKREPVKLDHHVRGAHDDGAFRAAATEAIGARRADGERGSADGIARTS